MVTVIIVIRYRTEIDPFMTFLQLNGPEGSVGGVITHSPVDYTANSTRDDKDGNDTNHSYNSWGKHLQSMLFRFNPSACYIL